jgi:hypothetical protein
MNLYKEEKNISTIKFNIFFLFKIKFILELYYIKLN